jgi:D-glycero-D-manno-heptose 1,7-bisphosphate phosphatase
VKLIILDRDGLINADRSDYVKTPDEWVAIPGSLEAIARISRAGYRVVIATNQSGLARGLFDMEALIAIHAKMRRELNALGGKIDAIFICPHGPDEGCLCRKPLPGLFTDIARRYDIDLTGVVAVGDSLRDVQASSIAGCVPWLVRTGNGMKAIASGGLPHGTEIRDDLAAVVDALLAEE